MYPILSLLALALAAPAAAQTQTLGPWTVAAPDSASLVAGGGGGWSSLNVVNSAVSVNDAFTGLLLDDDGYANADPGTVVECHFASGVVNGPGDDLVMFESQYDAGSYSVSADHDGFTAAYSFGTSGATIVSSKSYYYFGAGPYPASVVGVPVDLSSIGVAAGGMVHYVRFATTDGSCDPIGLGRIASGPTLTVTPIPLVSGAPGMATVSGATPGGMVGIAYSKTGPGPTAVPAGSCGVLVVSMSPPISVLATGTASGGGSFSVAGVVPPALSGATLFLHALDFATCTLTNPLIVPVL